MEDGNVPAPLEDAANEQQLGIERGNPPYLRKRGTEEIYAYNPYLAERDDMYPWPWPTIQRPLEVTPEEEKESEKISQILSAIGKLPPGEFNAHGVPKLFSLVNMLGFKISAAERDEAFRLYSKGA